MNLCYVSDITAPGLAMFASLTDTQLRNRLHPEDALIIVESPKVILTALSRGLVPVALLCEEKHITGDAAAVIAQCPAEMPIYTEPHRLPPDTRSAVCHAPPMRASGTSRLPRLVRTHRRHRRSG